MVIKVQMKNGNGQKKVMVRTADVKEWAAAGYTVVKESLDDVGYMNRKHEKEVRQYLSDSIDEGLKILAANKAADDSDAGK